ncbi:MAG: hypothetical protein WKG07_25230 [Hymenobacter sp.]
MLPALLPELAGKVRLIYIDPPFDTGANFLLYGYRARRARQRRGGRGSVGRHFLYQAAFGD